MKKQQFSMFLFLIYNVKLNFSLFFIMFHNIPYLNKNPTNGKRYVRSLWWRKKIWAKV